MAHRDDHDAALARADALQAELDRERAAQAEQSERVAALERELGEAKARLQRAEETLGDLRPKPRADVIAPPAPRAPDEQRARAGLAVVGAAALIGGAVALARCGERGEPAPTSAAPPPPPRPPFVVDRLLPEGLARVRGGLLVHEIAFDYVAPDGTLDPTHGRITIETRKPPRPRPPDDPNRPTGAPEPLDPMADMLVGNCPQQHWSPRQGWEEQTGSCLAFRDPPTGRPICTPASIVGRARADGAPEGLARIRAEWTLAFARADLQHGWSWSISIHDSARGVSFSQDYPDGSCAPPPVER